MKAGSREGIADCFPWQSLAKLWLLRQTGGSQACKNEAMGSGAPPHLLPHRAGVKSVIDEREVVERSSRGAMGQ